MNLKKKGEVVETKSQKLGETKKKKKKKAHDGGGEARGFIFPKNEVQLQKTKTSSTTRAQVVSTSISRPLPSSQRPSVVCFH